MIIYSLERERYDKRRVVLNLFDDYWRAVEHLRRHIMFQKDEEVIVDSTDYRSCTGEPIVLRTNKARYYIVERTLSM